MTTKLSPTDRYALVGKTGTGKSTFAAVIAAVLVPSVTDPETGEVWATTPWQVWWLDTKGDDRDLAKLVKWGFVPSSQRNPKNPRKDPTPARVVWSIRPGDAGSIVTQAQAIISMALVRHRVLIVVDEYSQIVPSTRSAGTSLKDAFARGRGLQVGIIGCTQEPVDVPRQLLSQASHIILMDLSYPNDQKKARDFYPEYRRPPDTFGFFHSWVDGPALWSYYRDVREWFARIPKTGQGKPPARFRK
jgi:energy-coupling factor transporter ATP-binding protein EcfA2